MDEVRVVIGTEETLIIAEHAVSSMLLRRGSFHGSGLACIRVSVET